MSSLGDLVEISQRIRPSADERSKYSNLQHKYWLEEVFSECKEGWSVVIATKSMCVWDEREHARGLDIRHQQICLQIQLYDECRWCIVRWNPSVYVSLVSVYQIWIEERMWEVYDLWISWTPDLLENGRSVSQQDKLLSPLSKIL